MGTRSPNKPRRRRHAPTAANGMGGLHALLLVGPRLVDICADWLYFDEVGFGTIWVTVILTRVIG
jgi:uncharacterized membrane protein (UPF0182 family)